MTAKYVIEQIILGDRLQMSISEDRYNELAHAREVLSDALVFEQRYEMLLGNFITMELELSQACLRAKVEHQYRYSDISALMETANRHVVNLLTAMRGYVNQVNRDFRSLTIEPSFSSVVQDELKKVFERSPDYRFMYHLRNHAQHKATTIHSFEIDENRGLDGNGWADAMRFFADKVTLSSDTNFDVRVLNEQPEKIDVRRSARRSVRELGVAHFVFRKASEEHVAWACSTIEAAIGAYKAAGAESVIALGARRVGDAKADIRLLLDWDDVRVHLVNKNKAPLQFWPRANHRSPTVAQIVELRDKMKHSCAQAAALVFISEESWRDYEDGLPMPQGLFHLYCLQIGQHPAFTLQPVGIAD